MFVGTCSDAGKSVINAAFCRIFKQDGYQPAPFKAQNREGVHFDLLLLGVTSYSPETGFACGVEEEALLKQTVLHRAEHVAVLLDSSKIDRRSTFRICGLDEVDTVISDGRLPPEFLSACENAGVKVL